MSRNIIIEHWIVLLKMINTGYQSRWCSISLIGVCFFLVVWVVSKLISIKILLKHLPKNGQKTVLTRKMEGIWLVLKGSTDIGQDQKELTKQFVWISLNIKLGNWHIILRSQSKICLMKRIQWHLIFGFLNSLHIDIPTSRS